MIAKNWRKPAILLIPNVSWWILADIGERIMKMYESNFEFCMLPESVLLRRPELLRSLLSSVDLVHCLNESGVQIVVNASPLHPPLITSVYHITRWSPDHEAAAKNSAAILACTESWKAEISANAPGRRMELLRLGVDTEFFKPKPDLRKRLNIPHDAFVVGFLGAKGSDTDRGRKGTDTLREVILKASVQLPKLHLLLGGPGWEKEVIELQTLGINVTTTGYVRRSELPSMYATMNVYLMTSRVEGGPVTVLEAMACEKTVVATRVGHVPAVIKDGINGFSVEPGDSEAITETLIALAKSPPRDALQKDARRTAINWDWHTVLKPLRDIYEDVLRTFPPSQDVDSNWRKSFRELTKYGAAADVLTNVAAQWRKGTGKFADRVRFSREIMSGHSWVDFVNASFLLKGRSYRGSDQDANLTKEPSLS
jgi:glycosyltransferase involved in cell wall biosynthesis